MFNSYIKLPEGKDFQRNVNKLMTFSTKTYDKKWGSVDHVTIFFDHLGLVVIEDQNVGLHEIVASLSGLDRVGRGS